MTGRPDRPDHLPARLIRIWRRHPVLGTLFPLAVALTLWFALQSTVHAIYWSDPVHRDQVIEGWMTPRYVGMSWDVPREVLVQAVGEAPDIPGGKPTLERIAEQQDIPLEVLVGRLEDAITAYRTGNR